MRRNARTLDTALLTSTRIRVTGTPSTESCRGSRGSTDVVRICTSARPVSSRAMSRHCTPLLLISG